MNDRLPIPPRLAPKLWLIPLGLGLILALAGLRAGWGGRHPQSAPVLSEENQTNLVRLDNRWCQVGHTNPFTGIMLEFYPDGSPQSRSVVSNGLLTGLSTCWYTNGQLQVRESFKEGVSDGLREKWYENGAKQSQASIVAGKIIGTFQSWYKNGQLAQQIEMQSGQPNGTAWAYYPSGFLKAKTTVKEGKVLDRRSWEDGQHRPTSVTSNVPLDSTVN